LVLDESAFITAVSRDDATLFVAEIGPSIAGYAYAVQSSSDETALRIHIESVGVCFAARRNGIARSLLTHVEEEMLRLSLGRTLELKAFIHPDNVESLRLFEVASYKVSGRSTGFYADGNDAVVVAKELCVVR
jgi:L-amino acid N-acyltransferase YncA